MDKSTFPQPDDPDDALDFAFHTGRRNITNYVEKGLLFEDVSYSGPQIKIGNGKAFIMADGDTTTTEKKQVQRVDVGVQQTSFTVQLKDNTMNHIWISANMTKNNLPEFIVTENKTQPTKYSLRIGWVDTANNEYKEINRNPDGRFHNLWADYIRSNDGALIYDSDLDRIRNSVLDPLTINTGQYLKGGGSVGLGGSRTISVDLSSLLTTLGDEFVDEDGDTMTGPLTLQDSLDASDASVKIEKRTSAPNDPAGRIWQRTDL